MTGQVGRPTLLFRVYRAAAWLLSPVAWAVVSRKLRRHDVSPQRMHERLGHASLPRPTRDVIWFHAASVGESLSVLTLIARMGERLPEVQFLITSGTATSAALVAKRLPPRTQHQFAPLDAPGPVQRFLAHWRPVAGIFVESELWPLMLVMTRASGARLVLLNARLSDRSVRGWRKCPDTARFLLGQFDLFLTQNRKAAQNLVSMGADPVRVQEGANLKSTSAPLPVDAETLAAMRTTLNRRPVWIASSTHAGEEDIVLDAHRRLLTRHPDLCLVLVPRHPERGDEVARLIGAAGLSSARRTLDETPDAAAQVYLADTLGETGTWYTLSPLVFLGGSLLPIGGHNPIEPALAGAAVITGPHYFNFSETFAPLIVQGGAVQVADAAGLADAVALWLEQPQELAQACDAAGTYVAARQSALEGVVDMLCAVSILRPPMPDLFVTNFNRNFTGVSATAANVVRQQAKSHDMRLVGHPLPGCPAPISLGAARALSGSAPPERPFAIWHVRRNPEMRAAIWARDVLRLPVRIVFTSAAQRRHSAFPRWLIGRMDAVVATTDRAAAFVPNVRAVVPHGVDTDLFAPSPDRAAAWAALGYGGSMGIATIGRIRPEKGTDLFVDAMLRLLPDLPGAVALVVGCATRDHHKFMLTLMDRVQRAGMIDRIRFVGEIPAPELPALMRALSLVMQLPRYEGYGMVPLEGLASAVPFVGSDAGYFSAFSAQGRCGVVVPQEAAMAAAETARAILTDPERHSAMAQQARATALDHFSSAAEARGIEAVYDQLWQGTGRPPGPGAR